MQQAVQAKSSGYLNMVALGNVATINAGKGRPGADPRVRKAMFMAIDPKLVTARAFNGAGVASNEIFPDYSIWHTDAKPLPHDLEQAKRLLAEVKADGFEARSPTPTAPTRLRGQRRSR